jgi:putative aminopeptidase FrvX
VKKNTLTIFILIFLHAILPGQTRKEYSMARYQKDILRVVNYLASDSLEGREAGSKGSVMASDYIATSMQSIGLLPFGDKDSSDKPQMKRSWFQNFKALSYLADRDSMSLIINEAKTASKPAMSEAVVVKLRNVLGMLPGKDSTRNIIIGAHYDHLGIRDGQIYNGADDNASGVSGMLALAKAMSASSEKPPFNIIFASWTAEEKGEIGSQFFLKMFKKRTGKILICINMDMISRSAPEDSTGRQLSIGTLSENENLRKIAVDANKTLVRPFELDLWDVSGHYGSDYAYFAEAGIPVMTFFSGFNKDYHTPADKNEKIDLKKMTDILDLVYNCIVQITLHRLTGNRQSGHKAV